jgi:hypothetical protein
MGESWYGPNVVAIFDGYHSCSFKSTKIGRRRKIRQLEEWINLKLTD